MKLETSDDHIIAWAAFRYCIGRMTYITAVCQEWIMATWKQFDTQDRKMLIKETGQAMAGGMAGMDCDVIEWGKLLLWMKIHEQDKDS